MTRFIALFRGINVGGHQVPMRNLKDLHEALGLRNVATYIQSGNVLFESDDTDPSRLSGQIAAAFEQRFGFHSAVILRNAAELNALIDRNPFQAQLAQAPHRVHVMFLATPPDIAGLDVLRATYAGPETFHLVSQELFLYYPDGMGGSKLTNALIEKKLKTLGTMRNWNTTLQLLALIQAN